MGWAARAKVSQGNPTQDRPTYRYIKGVELHRGFLKQPTVTHMRVPFSDRTYLIDRQGTLRRVPVELKPDA